MSKHTPGPWRYDYELGHWGEIIAANGTSVCSFADEPTADDARLIAAAVDLLEALEAGPSIEHALPFGNVCGCSQCQFVRLRRAAIAKATGEQA